MTELHQILLQMPFYPPRNQHNILQTATDKPNPAGECTRWEAKSWTNQPVTEHL